MKRIKLLSALIAVIFVMTSFSAIAWASPMTTQASDSVAVNIATDMSVSNNEITEGNTGIDGFLTRMYAIALNRVPDSVGINDWKSKLANHTQTGSSVAYGFIFSNEFTTMAAKMTPREYIEKHYNLFFGRDSDEDGMRTWLSVANGSLTLETRQAIFEGFANSTEFRTICRSFGVLPGVYNRNITADQATLITNFVERLYSTGLGREGDFDGILHWTEIIINGTQNGAEVAYGFFFSAEFTGYNVSDTEFVHRLYRCFFDRDEDTAGMDFWLACLGNNSRLAVFGGFVNSQEYANVCSAYGITRGVIDTPAVQTPYYDQPDMEAEVLRLMNEQRVANGLNPLVMNDKLSIAADIRAREIVELFSHTRPNGTSCFTVAAEVGYTYRMAAENIASGYNTAAWVMEGWMNSTGHRNNILNGSLTEVGIGCVQYDGHYYWVQFFGTPQ